MTGLPDRRSDGQRWSRSDTIAITLVTALACAVRGFRLTRLPFVYSDELFYAREACNYVYRSPGTCGIPLDAVSAHPPMGKWLISLGIRALGWEPIGWRLASLFAGTVTVAVLYVLARRVARSTWAATLAAGLLAIDFLHVVQSRIATLDVFLTMFVVTSFACLAVDHDRPAAVATRGIWPALRSRPWLLAAGAAAGGAIATKWVGMLAVPGVVTLAILWAMEQTADGRRSTRLATAFRREWVAMAAAFIILPGLVYAATYGPRVDGSLLATPWARASWVRGFAREQRDMLQFHRSSTEIRYLGTTNPFASPAWSWPLVRRPMIYYSEQRTSAGRETIVAMGNPLVWWAALLALASLAVRWARERPSDAARVAVVGFAFMYLPLLVVSSARSATFLYYMLPSVPFMCLAVAAVPRDWNVTWSRRVVIGFSLAAAMLFAFFYPVLVGAPLSEASLRARQWFDDCSAPTAIAPPTGWCWR